MTCKSTYYQAKDSISYSEGYLDVQNNRFRRPVQTA